MSEDLPSINDFIEDRSELPSVENFKEEVSPVIQNNEEELLTEETPLPQVKEEHPDTSLIVNLIESVRDSIPQVKSYDKELYEIVKLIEQFKSEIDQQRQLGEFAEQKRDNELNEQYRRINQVFYISTALTFSIGKK